MKILALDTSTSAASCAFMQDGKLLAEIFLDHKLQHSTLLFPMIEEVLSRVEVTIDDVDVIAVGGGPGSFTGLRIGVAAAKGLCLGGDKRFIAVSALDAMAFSLPAFEGMICPMMDALRENVYTALYKGQPGSDSLTKLSDYQAMHITELVNEIKSHNDKVIFSGDCIESYRELLLKELPDKAFFAPSSLAMPRASAIAELAYRRAVNGEYDNIHSYSPIYLRKPQAEREYEKKHGVIL